MGQTCRRTVSLEVGESGIREPSEDVLFINLFYSENGQILALDAGDGETYGLRVLQTVNGKIGLRVQYVKNHIIDGARTVNVTFDTLAEAFGHMEAYRQLTVPQAKTAAQTASPSGGGHGFVISSPRIR